MDYASILERRLRSRIARGAWVGAPVLAATTALAGCLDPHDYAACIEKADRSPSHVEFCAPAPEDGICPDYDAAEAEDMAHAELDRGNCGTKGRDVRKVVCGPESWGVEEPQEECCYVAKVSYTPADNNCIVGRPFLVAGRSRIADTCPRDDWSAALEVRPISDQVTRAAVVMHWRRAALAEHASVAAFARFTLQLLSLGAPPTLLREAQAASLDEIAHAELCFGLASAFGGVPLGPDPLKVADALDDLSIRAILESTIIEGCVGESIAALEAAACARSARDPVVRRVLAQIRDDETRHAELAWSFLAWLLEKQPALRLLARATFDAALELTTPPSEQPTLDLGAHGILSTVARADLASRARSGVLRRCADQLLGLEIHRNDQLPASPPLGYDSCPAGTHGEVQNEAKRAR